MKKFLAVLMAVVMTFSMVVISASAVETEEPKIEFTGIIGSAEDIYDDIKEGELESALDGVFALIEDFYNLVHNLIGSIMAVSGNECAVCGELHGAATEEIVPADKVVLA